MVATDLLEVFTQSFKADGRISAKLFGLYSIILWACALLAILGVGATGATAVQALLLAIATGLFISASWRRRNDVGLSGRGAWIWLGAFVPAFIGLLMGGPVAQDVPEVDPGLGDAGIFSLMTPEVVGAAAATTSNIINDLLFQLFCLITPIVCVFVFGIREIAMSRRPSVARK